MDSGITFKSQQLADQQQARGSQYQMQGAEAIGSAIGQAPGRFQQARQQQMDLARSAIENQTAEIQKAQMQEKLMATQQLRGLDMQRLQRDALDISVQHQRLQLDQARRQAEGQIEPKDVFHFAEMSHGELPIFPDGKGGLIGMSYDPNTRQMNMVPLSKDQENAYYMRHGHQAEMAKMSNDSLIAAMHATEAQYKDFGGGLTPGGQEALQPFIDELKKRGMGNAQQGGIGLERQQGGQQQAPLPDPRQVFDNVPDPGTLFETLPSKMVGPVRQKMAQAAVEYAKKYNLPQQQASTEVLQILNDPKKPQPLAKVLLQSGLSRDQAAVMLKNALNLSIEQAKSVVDEVSQ